MRAEMNRSDAELDRLNALDERIGGVLQDVPRVVLPDGFAARVAHEATARCGPLPDRRLASGVRQQSSVGRLAMFGGLVMLVLAMIVVARFAGAPSVTGAVIESILGLEFAALAVYLGLRHGALR